MAFKHSLEALNRTFKDIKNNKLFGSALFLLSCDFRQTLSIIPRSMYADGINACLKSSSLWCNVEKFQLKINMCPNVTRFIRWHILKIIVRYQWWKSYCPWKYWLHKIDHRFLHNRWFARCSHDRIFPDVCTQIINYAWLAEKAILAAKNMDVDVLNFKIQKSLPGDLVSYKLINKVCDANEAVNYPTKFLNSLYFPAMPPHLLGLKVGSSVILLQNLNSTELCDWSLNNWWKTLSQPPFWMANSEAKMFCCHAFQWFPQTCQLNSNAFNFLLDWHLQ